MKKERARTARRRLERKEGKRIKAGTNFNVTIKDSWRNNVVLSQALDDDFVPYTTES
jgi:hypothetical protein